MRKSCPTFPRETDVAIWRGSKEVSRNFANGQRKDPTPLCLMLYLRQKDESQYQQKRNDMWRTVGWSPDPCVLTRGRRLASDR